MTRDNFDRSGTGTYALNMRKHTTGRGVHWQAPTVILLAFAVSLALAIGHHLFYTSLDQVPVENNVFSQPVSYTHLTLPTKRIV